LSYYEVLLFLHVAAAIVWLGAGFTFFLLSLKAERSADPMEGARLGESAHWLTPRLFIPSSLATLVLGILLVIEGPWGFDQLWILIGLAGYVASFLTGILLISPGAKKLAEASQQFGPGTPQASAVQRRLTIISRTELAILFVVVADMAIKPTGDDAAALVLMALATLAAAAASYLTAPKLTAAPAPATE
jgi:uncharacterized membrane protein